MTDSTTLEKAKLYEKYRLPYANAVADDLLNRIGKCEVIADIGAGTGQLTRLFANKCKKIYLVEPSLAMRTVASFSCGKFKTVEICANSAEQIAVAENSIDLIVIGNAFHRFRPEATKELRRILKKHGWVALFSYKFKNQAFTQMLFSKLATLRSLSGKIDKAWHKTPIQELFGGCQTQTVSYPQSHEQDWTAFFGAACSGIEAPERTDREFAQFERINREVFDKFAVNGIFQIDFETHVLFGRLFCLGANEIS